MIPYDDLVVALQTWRTKKGLPIAHVGGAVAPAPVAAAPRAPAPAPGSGRSVAGSKPPAPPRAPSQQPITVTTQQSIEPATDNYDRLAGEHDVEHEVSEHELTEGDDFAMAFHSLEPNDEGESTAIGSAPAPAPARGTSRRNDDW